LVTFEIPLQGIEDHHALFSGIAATARQRTPQRVTQRWLRHEPAPAGIHRFLVKVAAEDTAAALRHAQEQLEPRLLKRESIALDFIGLAICTQSFLHALLYEALRLAWAKRVPIYIANATPAVRSGLDLLESYSLGG
jgi:hypothetical protein